MDTFLFTLLTSLCLTAGMCSLQAFMKHATVEIKTSPAVAISGLSVLYLLVKIAGTKQRTNPTTILFNILHGMFDALILVTGSCIGNASSYIVLSCNILLALIILSVFNTRISAI